MLCCFALGVLVRCLVVVCVGLGWLLLVCASFVCIMVFSVAVFWMCWLELFYF